MSEGYVVESMVLFSPYSYWIWAVQCYTWNSQVACHKILKELYDLMSEIISRFRDFGLKQNFQYSTESCDFASCILRALNFVFYIKGKT
jgi:hypothetical protein